MASVTTRSTNALRAAPLCVAALWWLGLGAAPPPPEPCPHPTERSGAAAGSVWVACSREGRGRPLRGAIPLLFGRPLDLNRAPAEALEALPGIGPVRARRIAEERVRRPFASLPDLARVRGIGPGIVARLEGWAEAGAEAPRRSQKRFQLLSNPCENSYKRRADPTGEQAPVSMDPERPGGSGRLHGLQGGSPSCD